MTEEKTRQRKTAGPKEKQLPDAWPFPPPTDYVPQSRPGLEEARVAREAALSREVK